MKETTSAGPAPSRTPASPTAAVPRVEKIPAPITAPIPNITRSKGPSVRFSPGRPSAAAASTVRWISATLLVRKTDIGGGC
jgi:hypothetical protein